MGFFPQMGVSGGSTGRGHGSYRKVIFMCWLWLFLAIVLEVAATVCLKLSDGFSKTVPTALMALLYALSFIPLALALRRIEVGVVYAVWSAVGTALITLIGFFLFKEVMTPLKMAAITMIVVGVVVLNLSQGKKPDGPHAAHVANVDVTATLDAREPSMTMTGPSMTKTAAAEQRQLR